MFKIMIDTVNVFVQNTLSRLTNITSICLIGSRNKEESVEQGSDLDIMVLVDDTEELNKNKVKTIVKNIGKMVDEIIDCEVLFLTEFWKYVNSGSPIIYHMIKNATIYYDTGFFETIQKLMRFGCIKPKSKAVDQQLSIAKQLMKITYHSVNRGLINNLQGAVVSSTQSLLMEMGVEPPNPKQVPDYIKKFLVDENILNEEYYNIAKEVIQTHKDIEHNKKPPLSGNDLQKLYNNSTKFVTKIEDIISSMKK